MLKFVLRRICELLILLEKPTFHTRAMRRQFFHLVGRISPKSKPHLLRAMYQSLNGDQSAARTTPENEIDEHVSEFLSMEDPDVIVDLRELNANGRDCFKVFWEKCSLYLSECTSVQERRHDFVVYMAKAISIRDLIQEVTKLCPEGTPISSISWVQLNFYPRNPRASSSARYIVVWKQSMLYRNASSVSHTLMLIIVPPYFAI